jgi:hypothetical protein
VTCCTFCGAASPSPPPVGSPCPDCGLGAEGEGLPPTLPAGVQAEEVLYDLAPWSAPDRLALRRALVAREVGFRWEPGPVLVVAEVDMPVVEHVLDELDQAGGSDGVAGPAGTGHQVMTGLFVVADRLRADPAAEGAGPDLAALCQAGAAAPPPTGIDPVMWRHIGDLAVALHADVDGRAGPEVVRADATALRDLLRAYI